MVRGGPWAQNAVSRRSRRTSAATIALLLSIVGLASSADQSARVYVQVLDGEKPILGLQRENFEARQRGKSVPVLDVAEVRERQWIFFYDTTFGESILPAALEGSLDLLATGVLDGDRVGAVVYSGSGESGGAQLRVLEPTADIASVAEALSGLRSGGGASGSTKPDAASEGKGRARVGDLARALEDAAKILGSGTSSHIVLFSGAFDLSVTLGRDLALARERESAELQAEATARTRLPRRDSRVRRSSVDSLEEGVLETLDDIERSGCSIHPVRLNGQGEASSPTVIEEQQGPSLFAAVTGGETLWEPESLVGALTPLLERTAFGYRLTLEPRKYRGDGRFRAVEVRLLAVSESARLIAPAGYYESP